MVENNTKLLQKEKDLIIGDIPPNKISQGDVVYSYTLYKKRAAKYREAAKNLATAEKRRKDCEDEIGLYYKKVSDSLYKYGIPDDSLPPEESMMPIDITTIHQLINNNVKAEIIVNGK